ncbi:MAG: type II secretion system F family protein [Alphaproteobacteria bacterium]|nr:type II secretion system F family protein [Alphaproteobacteria bacterium]
MARFRYKAVAPTGEVVEGELEALARGAAIERLRELRHLPVRVEELPAREARPMRLVPEEERIEPVLGAPPMAPAVLETAEAQPAEAQPAEAQPAEVQPAEAAPSEPEPIEPTLAGPQPGDAPPFAAVARADPPLIERITLDQAVESLRAEFAAAPTAGIQTEPPFEQTPANSDDPLVLDDEVPPEAEPLPIAEPAALPESVAASQSEAAAEPASPSLPVMRWDVGGPPASASELQPESPASAPSSVLHPAESPAQPPAGAGWLEWQEAAAAIAATETRQAAPPPVDTTIGATAEIAPASAPADAAAAPFQPVDQPAAGAPLEQETVLVAPESTEPRVESEAAAPRESKRSKQALPPRLVPVFTRELQVLLSAGLPMDRALRILVESTADDRVAAAADALLARVRGGALLSEAMDATPDRFDEFLRTAVRAGEAGGSLSEVLDQVASYQERGQRLVRSVRTALIYPSILAFAAAFSVVLLLTLVVPQFETLFRQSAQVPPLPTRLVIAASSFLRDWGWSVPAAALVLWIAGRWRYADARRRARLHRRVLGLPVIGAVISGVSVERLSRSLATLLSNGVALPDALGLVANTVPNSAVAAAAAVAVDRVKQGERLADALEEGGVLPPLAVQLIRVGEESGRLVDMLARLAEIYAGEVDVAVRRLTAVIEPALILVIGAVVGGIVLSLLAAIAGLNALAL